MTSQCTPTQLEFHALGRRAVVGRFDGGASPPMPVDCCSVRSRSGPGSWPVSQGVSKTCAIRS